MDLVKVSFVIFVVCLSILVGLFYFYSPEEILVENMGGLDANLHYSFKGEIISVKDYEKVAYFTVANSCEVEMMIFKDDNRSFEKASGKKIIGKGHVLEKGVYVLDSFKVS